MCHFRRQRNNWKAMKNFKITLLLIGLIAWSAHAQTSAKRNINAQLIDPETNCVLRYYYFPNIEAYYDTQKNEYTYLDSGQWKKIGEIPEGFRGYSLYNKVSVIIKDYDDEDPMQFHEVHKKKYPYITKANIKKITEVQLPQ